ncbi:hypothetical protein BJV78DRAFT_1232822 [Lactifluus subvellereus]|nr:hypothetical protein BJV78DRAFT_1232822 [Lactifluus subvellereus]
MPALQPTAPSQNSGNSGLSCIPASLIERLLPRLAGMAPRPKRSSTWVAGDAGTTQGTTVSSPSARRNRTPLPPIMEVPAQEGPGLLPAMELPEPVPTPVFPEPSLPPTGLPEWAPTIDLPEPVPTMELSELPPPMDWSGLLSMMGPPLSREELRAEEEVTASTVLESILDLNWDVQDELGVAGITPPTRAEIEMSLSESIALPTDLDHATKLDRDVEMTDAEMHDLAQLALNLLDEGWTGYVDLAGCDRV